VYAKVCCCWLLFGLLLGYSFIRNYISEDIYIYIYIYIYTVAAIELLFLESGLLHSSPLGLAQSAAF
jgi:hypothetical protein